jgi:hypothetical protein
MLNDKEMFIRQQKRAHSTKSKKITLFGRRGGKKAHRSILLVRSLNERREKAYGHKGTDKFTLKAISTGQLKHLINVEFT